MRRQHATFPTALLPILLLLLSSCQPLPGESRVTATLLTDGTGVLHNGRPAQSGERLNPGDGVLTGFGGAALIRFSDGTTVQIVEAARPVYLNWSGARLDIRTDGTVIETITGAIIKTVSIFTEVAKLFNESRFIAVLEGGVYRHFLFEGRARMIFPEPGRQVLPGQYALVTPAGEVLVRPIPPDAVRELRARLDRWRFRRPRPAFERPQIGIIIGPRRPSGPRVDGPRVTPPRGPEVAAPPAEGAIRIPPSSGSSDVE